MKATKLSDIAIEFVDEDKIHPQIAMSKPDNEYEIFSLVKYKGTEVYQWVLHQATGDTQLVDEPFILENVTTIKDLTGGK